MKHSDKSVYIDSCSIASIKIFSWIKRSSINLIFNIFVCFCIWLPNKTELINFYIVFWTALLRVREVSLEKIMIFIYVCIKSAWKIADFCSYCLLQMCKWIRFNKNNETIYKSDTKSFISDHDFFPPLHKIHKTVRKRNEQRYKRALRSC